MKKYIALIYGLVLVFCLFGCTEERWLENNIENNTPEGGLPVEFVMDFAPTEIITRSGENSISVDEKTVFENGDTIQVVANFYKKGDTKTGANVCMNSVCCYLIYKKDEANPIGKWVNNTNEPLYWPWESEEASFQAFYYPGYDGLLKPGSPATPVLLEDLDIYTDPLMTELVENIPYGNAVPLEFKHKCARLILTDLESVFGSANYNELWLENTKLDPKKQTNAFELSIEGTPSSGTTGIEPPYSLDFNFTARQDDNKILIGGKTPEAESSETESPKYVVFFLPPGDYSGVSITRKFGRPLLSWENVDGLSNLEKGKSYTVSLNDLKGNIIIDDDDDWWKDDDECINDIEFNLQEFLNSISDGHSYSYIKDGKEIVVLEEIETNHIVLKKNINFIGQTYEKVDMHTSTKLDGNGHYFVGPYKPVFGTLSGELSNLGIKDCKAEVELDIDNPEFGILACENSANIDNIRFNDVYLNISSINLAATYIIGALIGDNEGSVKNVKLNNINVNTEELTIDGEHIIMGGLIGQSAENSSLENVEMSGDTPITVDNNVTISGGNGNIYCGGLVGLSSSDIINCKVRANVSTEDAFGMWVYTGGLVGNMRNRDNATTRKDHIIIENSIIDGTVHGGECLGIGTDDDNTTGHSSTGGIAGYTLRTDIFNCKVLGFVTSEIGANHTDTHEFYTIGGLVGAVRAADTNNKDDYPQVKENSVYAKVDGELKIDGENPQIHFSKAGWMAGIAPDNVAEEQSNKKYVETEYENVGYRSNVSPSQPAK